MSTTFYGVCPVCGAGVWADVENSPKTMLGPTLNLVCQRHIPVADVVASNAYSLHRSDRDAWDAWRERADAEAPALDDERSRPGSAS